MPAQSIPVVVTVIKKSQEEHYGLSWPEGFDVRYVDALTPEVLAVADYLVVNAGTTITPEMIDAAPKLRFIHSTGVSFHKIDYEYAASKGVMVLNCRAVNKDSVAEHCIGLMIDGIKKISYLDRHIRSDGFKETNGVFARMGTRDIGELTIGMIGMGAIGKEILKRLAPWGARLVYYDPFPLSPEMEAKYGAEHVDLDELCRISDAITLHVPVIPSTLGMIGKEQFDQMKDGVVFINVARGLCVDTEALVAAIESGKVGAFGVDVFDPYEPPTKENHPLLQMSDAALERVTMTTHAAGRTADAMRRMFLWCIEDCVAAENGTLNRNFANGITELKPRQ